MLQVHTALRWLKCQKEEVADALFTSLDPFELRVKTLTNEITATLL